MSEEAKSPAIHTTMDELLGAYEDELDIDTTDLDGISGAKMAQEVNLLKQASEQQMDVAMQREQSLQHGEAIDNFMPTGNVIATIQSIDEQKQQEINSISKSDPDYAKKVKAVEQRAKQTKYKAMKNLNT